MYNRVGNNGGYSTKKRTIMILFTVGLSIVSAVFIILILMTPSRISSTMYSTLCWDFCDRDFDYNGQCCEIFQVNCINKQLCRSNYINSLQTQRTVFIVLTSIFMIINFTLICLLRKNRHRQNPPIIPQINTNPYIRINPINQSNQVNNMAKRKVDDTYESFIVESKDATCTVCLEYFNAEKAIMLKCGHIFHSRCIRDWAVKQENCPVCRASH